MTNARNAARRGFLLCVAGILCLWVALPFPCASSPLLGVEATGGGTQADAVLYFRYAGTQWLAPETRRLTVPHTQTVAEATVRSLIRGPQTASPYLTRLIPPETEVLAVQEDAGLLFVTLSGAFLNPLPGEARGEAATIRRRMMTASLANTLTQSGQYRAVQVLVMRESAVSSSMRLSERVYLEDSDAILPPLTRDEDIILTPGRALSHILSFWQARDFAGMRPFVAASQPTGEAFTPDAAAMPTLLSYEVSSGMPAPDGSHAIVLLSAGGLDATSAGKNVDMFPVRLERQDSVWKINIDSLTALVAGLGGAP